MRCQRAPLGSPTVRVNLSATVPATRLHLCAPITIHILSNHQQHSLFLKIPATPHWFAGIAITSRIETNYDVSEPLNRDQSLRRASAAMLGYRPVAIRASRSAMRSSSLKPKMPTVPSPKSESRSIMDPAKLKCQRSLTGLLIGKALAGAGLGEAHDVLQLHIMIQLAFFCR